MGLREQLEHIADLARLNLTELELDGLAAYIDAAIEGLPRHREADVPPGVADGSEPRLRPDEVGNGVLLEPLHELAPAWRRGFFTVPSPDV